MKRNNRLTQKSTTAVEVLPDSQRYLSVAKPELRQALAENLGSGGSTTPLDLIRIRVPAGGGTAWQVPTLSGPKNQDSVRGVIIAWSPVRAFWPDALGTGAGNQPPACTSNDGERGIGNPGGDCESCPFNAFHTANDGAGNGKACREARGLLFLGEGELMPYYLPAPTMSIRPLKAYFMQLASRAKPYHSVVTELHLIQAQNATKITYSQIEPRMVRELDADEIAALEGYRAAVVPAITSRPILTRADFAGE